jgi:hypothetical protein
MNYKLFDFLEMRGGKLTNIIKEWAEGLQKRDRARLNSKLDMLQKHGTELSHTLLSDSGEPEIKKLRITGKKVLTLRPMLCQGPVSRKDEFTLLLGAIEKDRKTIPANAPAKAAACRQELINNPSQRCPHERVN